MPDYEEIIKQSQVNVKSLSDKLKDLDKLHQDIKELIKQPEVFDSKYQEIVKLSEDYTNTLGAATKKYLDGNNTLFVTKLSELSNKLIEFEKEISRLVNTDFTKLFKDLQKGFIEQTRQDLALELKRFEDKSNSLQINIDELRKQIERLEKIDLEKGFDKLQKTLSEIFAAVNAVNLTLTNIIQTLTGIVQTAGAIQTAISTNHKEIIQRLNEQDKYALQNVEVLENKITSLSEQINLLKKDVKMNRVIQIFGLSIVLITLIYFAYQQS